MVQTREFFEQSSYIFSLNREFIEELQNKYLEDPESVDPQWRPFFESVYSPHNKIKESSPLQEYRDNGHLFADLDPLGISKPISPLPHSPLKKIYCGHIGYEFVHLDNAEQKEWLQSRIESFNLEQEFTVEDKKNVLDTLLRIETFEQFLQLRFPSTKRFSIEGGESSIIAARRAIKVSTEFGVKEVVLGMPHRGRLSMLTKILNKPYPSMLSEFQGSFAHPETCDISGDVKYHLGLSNDVQLPNGKIVHLSLTPNPSHLEAVDPVVLGRVRAKQDMGNDKDRKSVMGLLMHGDAAFAGQGVVMETLMLSTLPGYTAGGIVHIVVNNQIGFTADPQDVCSGKYVTEIAKVIKAPIFHVNGNDVEAVMQAAKIAAEYRAKFAKDVVIDVICYRLHGHNEMDEPRFTQPLMYKAIEKLETPGKIFADKLVSQKEINKDYYVSFKARFKEELDEALNSSKSFKQEKADWFEGNWTGLQRYASGKSDDRSTGVDLKILKDIGENITNLPAQFGVHKTIMKFLQARKEAVANGDGIDWSTAEALALGSLLYDGTKVRFSGQDSRRGTFSQRHSVLTDQSTGEEYVSLNNIKPNQAKLEIIDSCLSEFGVMGFEYGYSTADPNTLVIWEAQFGDFSNGAQIIIDQFISSAEEKWMRSSGLALLLPHGYEGQGPEHSSARLERYLQLCARDNMQVVNCTTPANYFHVLRRQICRNYRKPLVVMSPKSLLRHKLAISSLSDFAPGTCFIPVILDNLSNHSDVKKVIICSGKIYYDLVIEREAQKRHDVHIIRLEQYYPFPSEMLLSAVSRYKNVTSVIWCQEEPENMGAWFSIRHKLQKVIDNLGLSIAYIGREESASTSAGYAKMHEIEQQRVVKGCYL